MKVFLGRRNRRAASAIVSACVLVSLGIMSRVWLVKLDSAFHMISADPPGLL